MDSFALTMGEASGAPATPQELEERLRTVDDKVRRDAREIVEVLRIDFPKFVERVVKDRFVTSREFADSVGDQALKALKADVQKTAKQTVDELIPPLEEWGIWLDVAKAPGGSERRDLQANAAVHARLQQIGGLVRGLLERHKFPGVQDEDFREAYRLPAWFIAGRLGVSLVESYWRNVDEYLNVRDALRTLKERDVRTQRSDRWDSV